MGREAQLGRGERGEGRTRVICWRVYDAVEVSERVTVQRDWVITLPMVGLSTEEAQLRRRMRG